MKLLIATTLLASLTAVTSLSAHCGNCGVGDNDHKRNSMACTESALDGYYDIQSALAADDLDSAQSAAQQLKDMKADGACAAEGKECCKSVLEQTEAIAKAKDLPAARAAFQDLSEHMIAHVESHGADSSVFKVYCPMAFNNTGAAWLQSSKDVSNPYFGSQMLKCGSVQEQLSKGQKGHSHGDHDHSH